MNLNENTYIINHDSGNLSDPVDKAIFKYKFHPSILLIKSKLENQKIFLFQSISKFDISNNDLKKVTKNTIPPKILKISCNISAETLHNLFNECLITINFPDRLKLADITPVSKKKDPLNKENYKPAIALPSISKIFEKLMQKQINGYINNFLSPYLCDYRKDFTTQLALLSLTEKWKKVLDNKDFGGAVLMDLFKVFDTINHDLLIAKLHAYGFDKSSLKLLFSYLNNRWHRTKINQNFSSWDELFQGVPQGSVLGPFLFNIYLNDLFYLTESTEICNFADDTTFFACDKNLNSLIKRMEHDSLPAIEWFQNINMKLNHDKCHLLVSGYKHKNVWAQIGDEIIWESNKNKLLGLQIDRNLNFNMCLHYAKKLAVLARLSNFMSIKQRRVLMKSVIESQFSYCTLNGCSMVEG